MKRLVIIIAVVLTCNIAAIAANWREVDCVDVPSTTTMYYDVKESGKVSYYIVIKDFSVSVSKTNAEKFLAKRIKLELVKWYNPDTGKFKYTTRQKFGMTDVDLRKVFSR